MVMPCELMTSILYAHHLFDKMQQRIRQGKLELICRLGYNQNCCSKWILILKLVFCFWLSLTQYNVNPNNSMYGVKYVGLFSLILWIHCYFVMMNGKYNGICNLWFEYTPALVLQKRVIFSECFCFVWVYLPVLLHWLVQPSCIRFLHMFNLCSFAIPIADSNVRIVVY